MEELLRQKVHSYGSIEEIQYKYGIGELVYSLWKGQLWKAVVLDVSLKIHPEGWHPIYFVGYVTGRKKPGVKARGKANCKDKYYYNRSDNEWKSEALIFKIDKSTTKKSLETQKQLLGALKKGNKAVVESMLRELNSGQDLQVSVLRFNKIESEWFDFSELVYSILVNDKRQIEQSRVLVLPRDPCIEDIFRDYLTLSGENKCKEKSCFPEIEIQSAVLEILIELFNKTLKRRLIYPLESQQVNNLEKLAKDVRFSQVYSLEHLLRLLISLPRFLGDNVCFGDFSLNLEIEDERHEIDHLIAKSIKSDIVYTVNSLIEYINGNFQKFSIGKYKELDSHFL
ncbi:MRG-domain-containing protein [Cryptosporidium felis]|nr:MRG-domain-containing protein [Cryptosporidium felis]